MAAATKVGEASVPFVTSKMSYFQIGAFRLNPKRSEKKK